MKIYNSEKAIANLLKNKVNASLVIPIALTDDKTEIFINSLKDMTTFAGGIQKTLAKVADELHPDLLYGSAILVSTALNKNDDVFLPDETWKARATPLHQPYNDDHVEEDIIGHIIASRILDKDNEIFEGDEPPSFFNIEVDFVVYKGIFPAIAKEIAEKGPKGEKFVSMEAKFDNFDYAFIESNQNVKVYARNEETAFLTKYLKAYGGEGKYRDQRIGRVLRNFRFVGMGNVDIPANPASEFTKLESFESASLKDLNLKSETKTIIYITKGNIMELKTLEDAQKVIADLQKKLTGFEAKAELEAKAALDTEKGKADLATQKYTEANTKVEQVTKELETTKASLVEKTAELEKIAKAAKANDRLSQLKELGHEVTDEAKRTSYANMSDEAFASILDFAKTLAKKAKADPEDGDGAGMGADASKDDKKKDKKDKKDDNDEDDTKASKDDKKDSKDDKDDKKDKDKDKKDKDKSGASAIATASKAVEDAQAVLDKVIADTKSDITRTAGDTTLPAQEQEKVAAKLIEALRKSRSTERFGRKTQKKE